MALIRRVPRKMPSSQALTASGILTSRARYLTGWAVRETAGAAAVFRLYDGTTAAGVFMPVSLVANESERELFSTPIPLLTGALYFQLVSGTIEGSVWWA